MKYILCIVLLCGAFLYAQQPKEWNEPQYIYMAISEAEAEAGLPIGLLHCVGYVESRFNPKALSPVTRGYRSCGVVQLYRKYIVDLANKYHDGGYASFRWDDPYDNAQVGGRYLADLIRKFGGSVYLGLIAYNWGETRLRNINKWSDIPVECRVYANTILSLLDQYQESWR
jgi:hypothetical protein